MPLYGYRCDRCGDRVDHLVSASRADDARSCACGGNLARTVSAPAPTMGCRPESFAVPEGFSVVAETDSLRVRQKGESLVLIDWRCTGCARTWFDTYGEAARPAAPPACTDCGAPAEEIVGVAGVDWFTRQYGATGGYYDRGLGCWVSSRAERSRLMAERGLVEFGEVGDIHDAYQRNQAEQADESDRVMREMLREFEHGTDAPGLKMARDRKQIAPWDWAIDAVGGLDRT